jgi:hypothetical protein
LSSQNNTIQYPKPIEHRFEDTVKLFEEGYDNDRDLLNTFISLLDEGYDEANYFIGCIYETGEEGVTKDLDKAIFYYNQAIENVGDVESYLALARIYFYGLNVQVDYEKAFKFYSLVESESNVAISSYMLGKFFMEGLYVDKDLNRAKELFQNAINLGNVYAIRSMADLEKHKGNHFKSAKLKLQAGLKAFLIAIKNPKDIRLRAG